MSIPVVHRYGGENMDGPYSLCNVDLNPDDDIWTHRSGRSNCPDCLAIEAQRPDTTQRYWNSVKRYHVESFNTAEVGRVTIEAIRLPFPCVDNECQLDHHVVLPEQWYRDLLMEARAFRKIRKFFTLYGDPIRKVLDGAQRGAK